MGKYLLTASYTADGAKGLAKEGGTTRAEAAAQALKSVGATVDAFYFAFGDADAYILVDAPDHASIAAASLAIKATGLVQGTTVVLLTPEELDQATKKKVTYRAPGQ